MTPEKIIALVETYDHLLRRANIPKIRMDIKRTFGALTPPELLAHAHFLCDGVKVYARDLEGQRKAGSHLTAIQMCLSFAGWFTLEDLMNHNRPNSKGHHRSLSQ